MRKYLWILFGLSYLLCSCDLPAILSSDEERNLNQTRQMQNIFLSVEITGGFAGVHQLLNVSKQGEVIFLEDLFTGKKIRAQLHREKIQELQNLILTNYFFQLGDRYINNHIADAFFYTIQVSLAGKSKTVQTNYYGAPQNLKNIVDAIVQVIQQLKTTGIELTLSLSKDQIRVGEEVELTLHVTNKSGRPLGLHFTSGQIFDFYAQPIIHGVVQPDSITWNWAHDKAFIQILRDEILQPGEARNFQVTWDGRNNDGRQVSGEFLMGAELVSTPGGSPAGQRLTIVERP